MFINLLAAFSFILIPYLTGRIFTKDIFHSFVLGSLFWFLTYFLVTGLTSFLHISGFETIIYVLVVLISAISVTKMIIKDKSFQIPDKIPLLLLGIISIVIYFLIWKNQTPYPMQLNWDIYEHITLANQIAKGHLSYLSSNISDTFTFNSYSPIFQILLSIPKIVFHQPLVGIYYYLEYFYFALTILACFILTKKIFQNTWIAFLAGIFSIFIFENFMVYTSLFLIPQNLAALLTIYTLTSVSNTKINKFLLGGALLFILLMHYVVGTVGILIILSYILLRKLSPKLINLSIGLASLILLSLLALNQLGNFVLTAREEATHFMFPLITKLGFLLNWFSLSLLFLPISLFTILKNGTKDQKAILILTMLTLGIALAPFSYFLKFFVFDHYFLSMILTAGIGVLITNLPKFGKVLAITWISFCLLIVFFNNQFSYKEILLNPDNQFSHISKAEIDASNWLSQNVNQDTLLVSDPGTQYILEALSEVNSQGGAYMNTQTRQALSQINNSNNIAMIKNKLTSIQDELPFERNQRKNTILVLSGRYFAWQQLPQDQKSSFYYNIWKPFLLSTQDLQYINSLVANQGFKVLYQNNELVIIKI